jgi:hypothetical protein
MWALYKNNYIIASMKSQSEIRELERLSAGLAPKSGCTICRLIFIATVILFISSVLLALFALGRSHMGAQQIDTPRVLSADQSSERIRVLREYIESQRGSTTLIIGKTNTK